MQLRGIIPPLAIPPHDEETVHKEKFCRVRVSFEHWRLCHMTRRFWGTLYRLTEQT